MKTDFKAGSRRPGVVVTQDQTAGSAVRTGFLASIPWRVKGVVFLVFFTATGYGYFQVLVSAYLPQIGFSSGSVGLILGVNGIAVVLASVPLGLYADRKGKRPILFVGLVVFPFTLLAFAVLRNLAAFLVAGAVAGLVEGAFLSTWNALIADMTTPQNRNHAFSLSFIVASFAFGLGYAIPFVFPFLGATFNLGLVQVHQYATIAISAFAFVSPAGMLVVMKGYAEPERKAPGSANFR